MRTCSLPRRPSERPSSGSRRISSVRCAHCSTLETRKPVTPSSICSGIPPTSPPMNGRALPDRLRDRQPEALAGRLLDQHVGVRLEGVDLDRADVVEVVEDVHVGVAVGVGDRRVEEVPPLGVVARHRADQRELHLGHLLLDQRGRRRSRPAGPSRGRSARPGRSAAGRRRSRTGRTRTRRPPARAPCSSASAGRSPAAPR